MADWECKRLPETKRGLSWCKRCEVALSCGLDCHRAEYYNGHRENCTALKEKKKRFFLESLEALDKAHEMGVLEGVKLNCDIDYYAVLLAHKAFAETVPGMWVKHQESGS